MPMIVIIIPCATSVYMYLFVYSTVTCIYIYICIVSTDFIVTQSISSGLYDLYLDMLDFEINE
jgi:hypothetical protein